VIIVSCDCIHLVTGKIDQSTKPMRKLMMMKSLIVTVKDSEDECGMDENEE